MKRWLAILGVGGILSGCSGMPQVNSEPKFKTQYNASETTFQGVPISKYSNAERRHLFIYHYDVAPDVIFDDLVRLKGMEGVRWDDNGTGIEGPGKGTIRWVSLAGGEIPRGDHGIRSTPHAFLSDRPRKEYVQVQAQKSYRRGHGGIRWSRRLARDMAHLLRLHDEPPHAAKEADLQYGHSPSPGWLGQDPRRYAAPT